MSQPKIIIAGKTMPDAQGTPVAVNFQIDDIEGGGSVAGSYASRTVTIPATKDAGEVFAGWQQGRVGQFADKLPARVEVEGTVILQGTAQLEEVVMADGIHGREAAAYKVALFGNNAAWFEQLKGISLSEVVTPFITGQTFTNAFISLNDNADPDTQNWGLFLARCKDWQFADRIERIDLSFFVFIAPVIREAFRRVGYHLDSDFLDTPEGKRYIHPLPARPYSAEYMRRFEVFMEDEDNLTSLPVYPNFTAVNVSGNLTNDNAFNRYNTVLGFYTVGFSGHYTLSASGLQAVTLRFTDGNGNPITAEANFLLSETVFLNAGDTIVLQAAAPVSGGVADYIYISIKPSFEFNLNYTIDLGALCAPSWNVADILLGLVQAFNLRVDTDVERGRVRIEPADAYITGGVRKDGFYRRPNPIDVSNRVDLLKPASVLADNKKKRRTKFEWKADGADENIKSLDKSANLPSGSARFTMSATRYQDGTETKEVNYFAKTLMYRASEIKNDLSSKIPVIPLLQPSELNKRDSAGVLIPVLAIPELEPRILYFAGRRNGLDGRVNLQLGPGLSTYDFPAAWFVCYPDHTQPSLSFAEEQSDLNETCAGLLSRFHLQDQYRRALGRTVEESIFWNAAEIAALDFRRGVHLRGQHFLLKKIEAYRPGTDRATKTILEADAPPIADNNQIENTPIKIVK